MEDHGAVLTITLNGSCYLFHLPKTTTAQSSVFRALNIFHIDVLLQVLSFLFESGPKNEIAFRWKDTPLKKVNTKKLPLHLQCAHIASLTLMMHYGLVLTLEPQGGGID